MEIDRQISAHLELCAIICFDASRQGSWGVVPSRYKNPTRDGDPIDIKHLIQQHISESINNLQIDEI